MKAHIVQHDGRPRCRWPGSRPAEPVKKRALADPAAACLVYAPYKALLLLARKTQPTPPKREIVAKSEALADPAAAGPNVTDEIANGPGGPGECETPAYKIRQNIRGQ